jgi:hypothetical protein
MLADYGEMKLAKLPPVIIRGVSYPSLALHIFGLSKSAVIRVVNEILVVNMSWGRTFEVSRLG